MGTWNGIKHFIDSRNVFTGHANIMMYEIGIRPVPLVLLGSPTRSPLGTISTAYPTQIMAVDLVGPFPESDSGNSYIMVVADYFSRWMEVFTYQIRWHQP